MIEVLTAILVLITGYYAWQNQRMVGEMKRAREASVMPSLGVDFARLGPRALVIEVRNVGPGAALDIDAVLTMEAIQEDGKNEKRRWRRNNLVPGDSEQFMPPVEGLDMDLIVARYRRIRLEGSMKDAMGNAHTIDEVFDDLPEWRSLLHGAAVRWVAEPEKQLADALEQKFRPALQGIQRGLTATAQAVQALKPPSDDDT